MNSNNPFGDTLQTEGLEESRDSLGGFAVLDTDVYGGEIVLAYAGESSGGAKSMTYHVKLENGQEYRETVYVTSGKAKGQKNFYEKNGKKYPMPGYVTANDIALLATGHALTDQEFEEKVVNLYNFEEKKELPTKVMVATSLLGKPIKLGIQKQIEDKNVKDANGNYVPSGETRETNVIDKVFHYDSGRTVSEITGKQEEAKFQASWLNRWQGQTKDKSTGASGDGKAGAPAAASGAKAPTKSLFG